MGGGGEGPEGEGGEGRRRWRGVEVDRETVYPSKTHA